jgi:hypothetical protein
MFRVVTIDHAAERVGIQTLHGVIEEIGFKVWQEVEFVAAKAPEDWIGLHDEGSGEYLGHSSSETGPGDGRQSLERQGLADASADSLPPR